MYALIHVLSKPQLNSTKQKNYETYNRRERKLFFTSIHKYHRASIIKRVSYSEYT